MAGSLAALAGVSAEPAAAAEFGVYEGAGCSGVARLAAAYTPWAPRPPDRMLAFLAIDSWQAATSTAKWEVGCWKAHGHPKLTMTVPLTVKGTGLAEVAAGHFDNVFAGVGRTLVRGGYGDAIIRLGPEMNGNWFPWGNLADRDPATQGRRIADFKAAFVHVVGVLRNVDGAHFRIDWCPNAGPTPISQTDLYPGDDVVDIVGTDVYATLWGADHPSAASIIGVLRQGWQLDAVAAFGRQHGKPISFPEWGVGDHPIGRANYGPGDSAEVMQYMIGWFSAHAGRRGRPAGPGEIAYLDYWDYDAGDYNSRVSNGERPSEGAVLRAALAAGAFQQRR